MGSMSGRVALVTGVSRPGQIAEAVARRLHAAGITVYATGWPPHDDARPWGGGDVELPVPVMRHDMVDPDTPCAVVDEVIDTEGGFDRHA